MRFYLLLELTVYIYQKVLLFVLKTEFLLYEQQNLLHHYFRGGLVVPNDHSWSLLVHITMQHDQWCKAEH